MTAMTNPDHIAHMVRWLVQSSTSSELTLPDFGIVLWKGNEKAVAVTAQEDGLPATPLLYVSRKGAVVEFEAGGWESAVAGLYRRSLYRRTINRKAA